MAYPPSSSQSGQQPNIANLLALLMATQGNRGGGQPMANAAPNIPLGGGSSPTVPYTPIMPGSLNPGGQQSQGGGDFLSNLLSAFMGNNGAARGKAAGKGGGGSAAGTIPLSALGSAGDAGMYGASLAGGFY